MIDIEKLKCHYCDKTYSRLSSLKFHCQTSQQHDVIESGIPQDTLKIKTPKTNIIAKRNRIERDRNLPEELQVNLFIKSLTEKHFDFNYLFY